MTKSLLIVHGYSDGSDSFTGLRDFFIASGRYRPDDVYLLDYSSMDDEATFEDFADKLDTDYERLFEGEQIDVACHSTGSLVVRSWLALRRARYDGDGRPKSPVRHLVMFSPANFGSDLAKLGQSFLGKIRCTFFNSHARAQDLMESGRVVLQGLEPASPLQWRLSHMDLHGDPGFFSLEGDEETRCYPFVLAAGNSYGGIEAMLVKKRCKPGTDGTVRICGTSLNTRKCVLRMDLGKTSMEWHKERKYDNIPFAVFDGFNHGSIIGPTGPGFGADDGPGGMALKALKVESPADYAAMALEFERVAAGHYAAMEAKYADADDPTSSYPLRFQQFFFQVHDDVGLSVPDFHLDFYVEDANGGPVADLTHEFDEEFESDFDTHSVDPSYRTMMVNCTRFAEFGEKLIAAKARLVFDVTATSHLPDVRFHPGKFVAFDGALPDSGSISFLCPNTTTLVEIVLDRMETDSILLLRDHDLEPVFEARELAARERTGRAVFIGS